DALALAHQLGATDGHAVVTIGDLAARVRAPRYRRLVGIAVERPVIDTLGLEEHHRIVVLDRADQQALGVVGVGGHDDLDAAHVSENALRALRVRLAAADAAAAGRADGHRRVELPGRAVTQPC